VSNKITAIIPTFNEEKHISEAIESVLFADEIIVIDSFSTDKTIEIAAKFNVKIIKRVFDDFSSQKNYAIEKATYDWVFVLDADERISKDLKNEILQTVNKTSNIIAYYIFRTYDFMGKRMKYSGFQSDKVIRLFKKEFCKYDGKLVHEEIKANGEVGFLNNKLEHFSYNGLDHYVNKLNHYAALQAKMLSMQGVKPSIFHFLIKPTFRFIKHYFIKLGFLDGIRGFIVSILFAYGVFMRFVKLWLIENLESKTINTKDVKIDAVFTWVDGNDEAHINKMHPFMSGKNNWKNKKFKTRFRQVNEIEYSVRAIIKYSPFIKNIYIVTDNQTPSFLEEYNKTKNEDEPIITIVDHTEIFKEHNQILPVFNCRPIETLLYKIPNLTEHFVYFNDDFILFKHLNPNDFFINGKPVLRGKWTKFDDKKWYKIINNKWRKLRGKPTKDQKYGYKRGQQNAARQIGFQENYFRIDHTPAPMRKSTFEKYFMANPEMEKLNVLHRFRNPIQYVLQSLSNHIEIKNGTYIPVNRFQLIYFGSYKKPLSWIKYKLSKAERNKDIKFLCMQSLDLSPYDKLNFLLKWLDKHIKTKA